MAALGKLQRETCLNKSWLINGRVEENGALSVDSMDDIAVAVLMDIRDELQKLNAVFACPNFLGIPRVLNQIKVNTHKTKRRKAAK